MVICEMIKPHDIEERKESYGGIVTEGVIPALRMLNVHLLQMHLLIVADKDMFTEELKKRSGFLIG